MAKKSRRAEPRRDVTAGPPGTPLGKARWWMEVGDVRRARKFAAEAASSGPEAERAEARALAERLQPDRGAMLTIGLVLLFIAFAAWAAILRAH